MNVMPQSCLASDGRDSLTASFSASYAGVLAFIAVAAEGSFARAGDRLGIGRSAVSRSVQKLEGQLGVRLFLRTTRSTTLTREGELFLEGCSPGVASILQALDDVASKHNASAAQIALAWQIARPSITAPIVSATSVEQLHDLLAAANVSLSVQDVAQLDAASAEA